ncbi:AraC family transcriptional regulator [Clostridium sp. YIM B02505]|uniref:AraC family transcriptional regulator n=1 Tax=Clostridium yunnanense TaxID=2800325 RepID=A0ABS1EWQ9_9CLOT|nr:AraC family transcriptional regulator [Clostridium yunnanense]MBK1813761.1 AraC family transcriptional regulator [Clostridium yunnanense]
MESLEKKNAVARMANYIEDHINEPITLNMLAKEAQYSVWYSARIFKEITGRTPFDYIRIARLSKAALRLRHKENRITDVAFDFVFDSHEGFTRAFSKQFGITPSNYCNKQPLIKFFIPQNIRGNYLTFEKGVNIMSENQSANTVFVQVVDRPERKVILKRGIKATHYFEYCEEVDCEVWDVLCGIKEALYEPIGMWLPKSLQEAGTSEYCQGVEVPITYSGEVPEGFDLIELPPCKMMVFQGSPYDDENFGEEIGRLWDTMKKYDPKVYGFEWADEEAPRFQLAPMGYRGYIEARPVRQLNI